MNSEVIDYSIYAPAGIAVNEREKEIQKKGLIRIKLPMAKRAARRRAP
jgi:hypothetical protein